MTDLSTIPPTSSESQEQDWALTPSEEWWRDHYYWLVEQGYTLRPRFHPDWKPSWVGTNKWPRSCEDYQYSLWPNLLDGTRNADGVYVKFKLLRLDVEVDELAISNFLYSQSLRSDPKNHCVPIYEVLRPPNYLNRAIVVMPLLLPHSVVPWDSFGEVVHFIRQIFEGLLFMHEQRVAHRDCIRSNIMMDAQDIFSEPWHPTRYRRKRDYSDTHKPSMRTECKKPIKYYFVDFGISVRFDADDPEPRAKPRLSGDKTAPEFVAGAEGSREWLGLDTPYDPFPTDVYYLGNFIRREFIKGSATTIAKRGFEFIEPLINDMVQNDPAKRPTMDVVVERFDEIVAGLTTWKLRSRVVNVDESWFSTLTKGAAHWKRRIEYIARRVPPIPK